MIVKCIFDRLLSAVGLIVLSPVLLCISVLVKLGSPGPIFFRQIRVGQYGKQFLIYKFRTMVIDAESKGHPITVGEDIRITKIGKLLRRYKLDEFPQLINVLMGDMSLVGPRPEVPRYVELFKNDYHDILRVKPGITDYAAIKFQDEANILGKYPNPEDGYIEEVMPAKIELYRRYLREQSLITDVKLIFRTLRNTAVNVMIADK